VIAVCVVAWLSIGRASYSQTTPAGLQVSPGRIDFGENAVASDNPPRTITLSNPTKSVITIEQILACGIDFSEKNDCRRKLPPSAQCTIHVSFRPAIPGMRTGNLEIMESNGNPQIVALSGTGK
jgi:hypothetical protein